jgi:hypothetical protein
MDREQDAIDGLLRELARAPEGDDEAFVQRVLAGTRKPVSHTPLLLAAAALLLAVGGFFAFPAQPATGRLGFTRAACLVPEATQMRILMKEPGAERLFQFGQVPIGADARVPAGQPILLQAVGADGLALWTSPDWIQVRPSSAPAIDPKPARTVDFARDVKPILDQHCSGCHAEAELLRAAVKPFEARRSPIVTQTHALLSGAERSQLALWVDLGAAARP